MPLHLRNACGHFSPPKWSRAVATGAAWHTKPRSLTVGPLRERARNLEQLNNCSLHLMWVSSHITLPTDSVVHSLFIFQFTSKDEADYCK